jgi:hypothetical protein
MNSEIFRFSVVRNPQRISSEKYQVSVVPLITEEPKKHLFYTQLIVLRQTSPAESRSSYIKLAKRFLKDEPFVKDLTQLSLPFWKLSEWLYGQEDPTGDKIKNKVNELFGTEVNGLVGQEKFKADKISISDSFIVVSIVKPSQINLRGDLMRARRLLFLLEFLAKFNETKLDAKTIRTILAATIILPADLFPIPHENLKSVEGNKEAYKNRKKNIEKIREKVDESTGKIKANAAAIAELSDAYYRHLFEYKFNEAKDKVESALAVTGNRPADSLTLLPETAFNKLSTITKKIIQEDLKISKNHAEVTFLVSTLEENNKALTRNIQDLQALGDLSVLDSFGNSSLHYGECQTVEIKELKAENDFTPATRGEVKNVGIQDLLIVRQELLSYQPGEIAHIDNIMKGELKSKKHRKLDRSEVTTFEESERTEDTEKELQTTDRFELQDEASKTISEDTSVQAGVTVTASYGPVNIEAHGEYSNNTATEESRTTSTNIAKEIISRSVQKIKARVLTRRSRIDVSEIEIINEHSFDNTKTGAEHINGIYRWVDKYYKAQIVNYGKRTMLEFMVPEPAAFFRYAMTNKPSTGIKVERPEEPGLCTANKFFKLKPTDLTPDNYLNFIGKYQVKDAVPPPSKFIYETDVLEYLNQAVPHKSIISFGVANKEFKITDGYNPLLVKYKISGGNGHRAFYGESPDNNLLVAVTIANKKIFVLYKNEIGSTNGFDLWEDLTQTIEWKDSPLSTGETTLGSYVNGSTSGEMLIKEENQKHLPVSITGHTTLPMSISLHYSVLCKMSPYKYEQWQIATYNAIMSAYQALRIAFEESERVEQFNANVSFQGRNPAINRETEKTELKKFAISILTGQQYDSFNAMGEDYLLRYPQIDLLDASQEGQFVRFFEQALEWRHMTYVFYPYFWGNKKNWVKILNMQDTDPLFEKFVQAGYARVWVPIRPGFESVVDFYIHNGGEPWTEKEAPLCTSTGDDRENAYNVPPSVSLIDEIKEQLDNDFVQRKGTVEVTQNEKNITGTDTEFTESDVDREILINLHVYRIAKVVSATRLVLREAYEGESANGLGYTIGVKFVGEPWVVKIPTSLVLLQESNQL